MGTNINAVKIIATKEDWKNDICVTTREKSDSKVNVELRRIKEEVDFVGKL